MTEKQKDGKERYMFALGHHRNKSVFAVHKDDWQNNYLPSGYNCTATAYFGAPPRELSDVCKDATVVGVELSLREDEPKPMDIVRLDSKDAPKIFNRDRYHVYHSPCLATSYPLVVEKYGIEDSQQLRDQLNDYVFLIGPDKNNPDHHTSQVAATLLRMNHEDS